MPFIGVSITAAKITVKLGMGGARVTVELIFVGINFHWNMNDLKQKIPSGEWLIILLYMSVMLLNIIITCHYGNTVP